MSVVAYGVRVGIRATSEDLLEEALRILPPGWKPAARPHVSWLYSLISRASRRIPGRSYYQVYSGPLLLMKGRDRDEVLEAMDADLQSYLSKTTPWRVFVHAGAVGWKGKAIVLPGRAGAGKTTLTAALVRAGATLYSDEYAIFDRQGRLHPYPRPLRMKGEGTGEVHILSPEALGAVRGERPIPLGLVLATRYRPGAAWRPRELSPGQAVMELLAHAVTARVRPEVVLPALRRALEDAAALKGPRGEAEEIAPAILDAL